MIDLLVKRKLQDGALKIDLPMKPINEIEEELESIGFEMEDLDDNTNGWQIDFWYYFNHSTMGKYTLSGSLWYGNFTLQKVID